MMDSQLPARAHASAICGMRNRHKPDNRQLTDRRESGGNRKGNQKAVVHKPQAMWQAKLWHTAVIDLWHSFVS